MAWCCWDRAASSHRASSLRAVWLDDSFHWKGIDGIAISLLRSEWAKGGEEEEEKSWTRLTGSQRPRDKKSRVTCGAPKNEEDR